MEKDVIIYNTIGSFFVFFGVLSDKKMMEDGQMTYKINLWNPITWVVLFVLILLFVVLQSFYDGVPFAINEAKEFLKDIKDEYS